MTACVYGPVVSKGIYYVGIMTAGVPGYHIAVQFGSFAGWPEAATFASYLNSNLGVNAGNACDVILSAIAG